MTTAELLAQSFGLDLLCEQNDINPATVCEWMIEQGWIDTDDYFYEDEPLLGDND